MSAKKSKTIQERRRERLEIEQRKSTLAKQIAEAEAELDMDIVDDELDTDSKESSVVQKDDTHYPEVSMPMPMAGPTSFAELDASKEAQQRAYKLDDVSWDVRSLVRNILNHPMMAPEEKAKAIQGVGSGFGERVSAILKTPTAIKKDIDALVAEALLAQDARETSVLAKIVEKAKMIVSATDELPDTDFALVKDVDGKKVRKYPVQDANHVRAALRLVAKEINSGGQDAIDAKEALPLILIAAKRHGIGTSMKKSKNSIIVEKDQAGDWRWIGWVSNNFIDTDNDIIAEVAHKEYVEFLDANPAMAPLFMSWHTPGTHRESLPDFWDYSNGFLMMSGKLTESEASSLLKAASQTDLGMSHVSLVLERDPSDRRVVTKYRMCEASDLPLSKAANPFTALETLSKEADMDKLEYLTQIVGKEKAEALVSTMQKSQEQLKDAGVVSKQAATPPVPANEKPVVPAHVMEAISKELGIPELSEFVAQAQIAIEKVPLLEAAVQAMSKSTDEQVAEKIAPPAYAWMSKSRPSEKDTNVIEEGDALLKNKPETGWLSEATGTKPIPQTA